MFSEVEDFQKNLAVVMHMFYHRLNCVYEVLSERETQFLFVPRAGFTILRQLNKFRKTKKLPLITSNNLFWINRVVVANAIVDDSIYLKTISNLIGKSHNKKYQMFESCFNVSLKGLEGTLNISNINQLVEHTRTKRQENFENLSNYLKNFQSKNLVLVDSGWSGTTDGLLSYLFKNEYNISSISFGVTKKQKGIPSNGLIFETNEFFEDNPLISLQFCKHLIEILLEPNFPSQKNLNTDKGFFYPDIEQSVMDNSRLRYEFSLAVEEYLNNSFETLNTNDLVARYSEIREKISERILFPGKKFAEVFSHILISHDMGTEGEIPIIGLKNEKIKDLWPQANYACFCHEDLIRGYQNQIKRSLPIKREFEKPYIDIITRTMDRPFFLERALKSVQNQSYNNCNQIITIDGEDPEPIFQKIYEIIDDPCALTVIVIHQNVGMEAASNIGVNNGDGKYILIHDDDDSLDPNFVARSIHFLEEEKSYQGVVTASNHVSETIVNQGIKRHSIKRYNPHINQILFHDLLEENIFAPISFVFTRYAFDHIGKFNEELEVLGDWDFNVRFLEKFNIGFVNEALANYHHRDVETDDAYGNSINTGIRKHIKFQPIVRNEFYRKNPAYALSSHIKFLKNKINNYQKILSLKKNMTTFTKELYLLVTLEYFTKLDIDIDANTLSKLKFLKVKEIVINNIKLNQGKFDSRFFNSEYFDLIFGEKDHQRLSNSKITQSEYFMAFYEPELEESE